MNNDAIRHNASGVSTARSVLWALIASAALFALLGSVLLSPSFHQGSVPGPYFNVPDDFSSPPEHWADTSLSLRPSRKHAAADTAFTPALWPLPPASELNLPLLASAAGSPLLPRRHHFSQRIRHGDSRAPPTDYSADTARRLPAA